MNFSLDSVSYYVSYIEDNKHEVMMTYGLHVGEIAAKAGMNVETLRYYEKIQLMPEPKRRESRYRYYDEKDLLRLLFIKRAKELGFTLKEIRELLELKVESAATCGDVKLVAEFKLQDVDRRLKDLKNIRAVLVKMIERCVCGELSTDECPILDVIEPRQQQTGQSLTSIRDRIKL